MARVINGLISGRVGEHVYWTRDGKQFIRKAPEVVLRQSESLDASRGAFGLTATFLTQFRSLLMRTWTSSRASGNARYQAAFSYVRKNVVRVDEQRAHIQYDRLLISRGTLSPAPSVELEITGDTAIVRWTMSAIYTVDCSPDDRLNLLLINEDKAHHMLFESLALRDGLHVQVSLPEAFRQDRIHGYVFFSDLKGRNVSDSVYLLPKPQ
ncbi:MAG: DUF6266 family protein [Arcticibacter sp.]